MTASSSLIRWSGLAAILGGLLWIVPIALTAIKPEHSRRGPEGFAVLLLLAALVLIGVGVLGIYLRQRGGSGPLGTIAVLVAGLGIVIMVPGRLLEPAIFFQAGRLIFLAGLVLFVVDMFVANMMPRGATLLLVIGTLALALFNFGDERIWIGVLFGAAWIWLGYTLWSGRVRRSSSPHMRDEERRRS